MWAVYWDLNLINSFLGQTEAQPSGGDFQERERALLGEDADLFQSGGAPQGATVEDGDDDLLGGDFQAAPSGPGDQDEINGFESSFPALDTDNAVRYSQYLPHLPPTNMETLASRPRRHNNGLRCPLPRLQHQQQLRRLHELQRPAR